MIRPAIRQFIRLAASTFRWTRRRWSVSAGRNFSYEEIVAAIAAYQKLPPTTIHLHLEAVLSDMRSEDITVLRALWQDDPYVQAKADLFEAAIDYVCDRRQGKSKRVLQEAIDRVCTFERDDPQVDALCVLFARIAPIDLVV